jgi:hypothetical protein
METVPPAMRSAVMKKTGMGRTLDVKRETQDIVSHVFRFTA